MRILTRADAIASGLSRYFTGEPCKYGHVAERTVCDYACVECGRLHARDPKVRESRREYMKNHQRNYRAKHPDRIKATRERQDKSKLAEAKRAIRAKDPERHRLALRKSFQKHKAKRLAEAKAWRKKNKEAWSRYMRPIKIMRRAAEGRFDSSDIDRMLKLQNNTCAACPADISTKRHVDHIIPITRGGTHWPSNLQLLCGPCNQSKGNKTMEEWTAWKIEMGYLSDIQTGSAAGADGAATAKVVSGTLLTN